MRISAAIKDYLLEIEVRKYTPKTIKGYRNNLGLFLRFCEGIMGITDLEDVTPAVVRQFAKHMVDKGRKGTYVNGLLKPVKLFIYYCYDEEMGGFSTRHNFKWCKEERPVIVALQRAGLCSSHMLFETGVRCWELCCIMPEDVYGDFVIIKGKNHKQRVVPIIMTLRNGVFKQYNRFELDVDSILADQPSLQTDRIALPYNGPLPEQFKEADNMRVHFIVKPYDIRICLKANRGKERLLSIIDARPQEIKKVLDRSFETANAGNTGLVSFWEGAWFAHFVDWKATQKRGLTSRT